MTQMLLFFPRKIEEPIKTTKKLTKELRKVVQQTLRNFKFQICPNSCCGGGAAARGGGAGARAGMRGGGDAARPRLGIFN